jgi:hypothetical protein
MLSRSDITSLNRIETSVGDDRETTYILLGIVVSSVCVLSCQKKKM